MKTLSNRKTKRKKNQKPKTREAKRNTKKKTDMQHAAGKRGEGFSDGWQPWPRSCQKIKVFKLKVHGVRILFRTASKPHFLKVNFRKTLSPGETIGAGNQIFTINLNNFVN